MTQQSPRSFEKFNYLLRPSKQVERKLLIETFHRLNRAKFRISDYTYVGLGSVYFVDFVLFHRYLYIDNMICVEQEEIPERMEFNRPYKFIELQMMSLAEFIPLLKEDQTYLVWLDYDSSLHPEILNDIDGLVQILAPDSILLITVDARPRLPESDDSPMWSDNERTKRVRRFYKEHFERYAGKTIDARNLGQKEFPTLLASLIREKIAESMRGRPNCEFNQLFNFLYEDNAPMLTIGGLIQAKGQTERLWNGCLKGLGFLSREAVPIEISVPPLTERERQWIDKHLGGARRSKKVPFELEPIMLKAYQKFARHYPSYHEAVV